MFGVRASDFGVTPNSSPRSMVATPSSTSAAYLSLWQSSITSGTCESVVSSAAGAHAKSNVPDGPLSGTWEWRPRETGAAVRATRARTPAAPLSAGYEKRQYTWAYPPSGIARSRTDSTDSARRKRNSSPTAAGTARGTAPAAAGAAAAGGGS